MFDGRNTLHRFPNKLAKVVNFLNEKAAAGEFEFCDSISYWSKNEKIIRPIEMGHDGGGYYFAVALAFVATQKDGNLVFSEKDNVWRWAWALHLIAGVADWKPGFMMRVIQSFEGKRENIDGLMNWATQIYGNTYYNDAVELMTLMPQYRVSIFAGLMENDYDRYCMEYPPVENADEFAQAFVKTNNLKEEEVNKAFNMALTFSSFTSIAAMAFFLSIRGRLDEERKQKCEERILGLLKGDTTPYVPPLCNWMFMEQEMTSFEEECVMLLIKGLKKENREAALEAIDNAIGIHVKAPEVLTRIFVCIAENLQPTDILIMEGCLRNLHEHNDYFLNMVFICAINTIVTLPYMTYLYNHISTLEDCFNFNKLFLNAPLLMQMWIILGAVGVCILSLSNIFRRLNDICAEKNTVIQTLCAVISVIGCAYFLLPLIVNCTVVFLGCIMGLILLFKRGKISSTLPYDFTKEFNWGAFLGTWLWGLFNKSYIPLWQLLVQFTPLSLYFKLYCGLKGNEWAYTNKKCTDVSEFNKSQEKQAIIFLILFWVVFPILWILFIFGIVVLIIAILGLAGVESTSANLQNDVNSPSAIEQKVDKSDTSDRKSNP